MLVLVEIWTDERVATFDVVAKVRESAFAEQFEGFADGFFRFAFEHF